MQVGLSGALFNILCCCCDDILERFYVLSTGLDIPSAQFQKRKLVVKSIFAHLDIRLFLSLILSVVAAECGVKNWEWKFRQHMHQWMSGDEKQIKIYYDS